MDILIALGRFLYELTLTYGVVGLAIGAFLESFGIPTASMVIDLTSGLLILSGRTTFLQALVISDLGLVLGSLASYYVGKAGGRVLERWRRHPPGEAERHNRAKKMIDRYGNKSILFAQLFGPARTWISFPAGAMGMDVKKFTVYTAIGGAIYCSIVITISLYFTETIRDNLDVIQRWFSLPVVIALLVALGLLLLIRKRWKRRFSA